MSRDELARMGQAIAEKFRGKAALAGVGSTADPKPDEAAERTLVEREVKRPDPALSVINAPQPESATDVIQSLPLDRMIDSPFQPRRRELGKKDLEDLANNIAANGQTTAIIVTRGKDEHEGKYHVHSGNRRCAALRLLGWTAIKAIVRDDLGEREAQRLALMDNLGREDLSAFEQAMGFKEYAEKYGLDVPTAARELGLSRRNGFRLQVIAKASAPLLAVLRDRNVSVRPAESLARLDAKDPRKALRVAKRHAEGLMSLDAIEAELAGKGSPQPRRTGQKLAELRVSPKSVRVLATAARGSTNAEERAEICAALSTFLWYVGIESVEAKQPASDSERPEAFDSAEEAA